MIRELVQIHLYRLPVFQQKANRIVSVQLVVDVVGQRVLIRMNENLQLSAFLFERSRLNWLFTHFRESQTKIPTRKAGPPFGVPQRLLRVDQVRGGHDDFLRFDVHAQHGLYEKHEENVADQQDAGHAGPPQKPQVASELFRNERAQLIGHDEFAPV